MSAFDFLTDHDKTLIQNYIAAYGPTIADRFHINSMASLDIILREWNENKSKDLLTLFGGQDLILSRPYSYVAQAEALSQKIEEADNDPAPRAFRSWYQTMKHTSGNDIEITDMQGKLFRERPNWWFNPWFQIDQCMNPVSLATNSFIEEDCIINFLKSGKKMKVFRGMKPMKILHRIVQEFNGPEDIFDAYRTWHSMQLNQKRMDGELCLSIHPLDFITMSDNDNGWKSCMRWTDPTGSDDDHGDFRSGTVQCMNSPYIIIAYLHNPDHVYHPFGNNTYWNSKQWRELFIVQDGVINEIKGYPFQDENLTNTCLMWIKELANKNLGWTYNNNEVDIGQTILTDDPSENICLIYDPGSFMYKDIGAIQKHRGRINSEKLLAPDKYLIQGHFNPNSNITSYFITIPYGGIGTCMCCGNPLPDERSERVMCDDCDTVQICDCCGEPILNDYVYWVEERDGPICENCYEDSCGYDSFNTDEWHILENMTEIRLLLGYDENDNPIFHESIAMTYEPEDINSNFRDVFPDGYHKIKCNNEYFSYTYNYVTIDEVNDGYLSVACDAFDIYPRNIDKFFERAVIDYDLVYDYKHQCIYIENE